MADSSEVIMYDCTGHSLAQLHLDALSVSLKWPSQSGCLLPTLWAPLFLPIPPFIFS